MNVSLLLAAVLFVADAQASPTSNPERLELAKKALRLSHATDQIASISSMIDQSVGNGQRGVPAKTMRKVEAALRKAFEPARLTKLFTDRFYEKADVAGLPAVIRWYESRLGAKIAKLENELATPQGMSGLQEYSSRLQAQPPDADALSFARNVESHVRGTEISLGMVLAVTRGLATGLTPFLPKKKRPKPGEIERHVASLRGDYEPAINQSVLISYLYVYRDLSDSEKTSYLTYLATPEADKFNATLADAFLHAFEAASTEVGRNMGGSKKNRRAKR